MKPFFFPEAGDAEEGALLDRAARWDGPAGFDAFAPENVGELTAREGCDFATTLLHRRIVDSEAHGPFLRRLGEATEPMPQRKVRVVIVPGAFHRENPRTGADGRLPREVAAGMGLPVAVAPLSGTGSLEENARSLVEWLPTLDDDLPLVLVSVSKGGGDVKRALARPDAAAAFAGVRGWLNICGILDGTPMADWLLSAGWLPRANRLYYRLRGRSLDFLGDLRPAAGGALDFPLTLPAHLRAVHIVGFPLHRHLHNGLARRCHDRLAAFGPNDGSILLAGTLRWPGQLCPVWGADHYLRPREDVRPLVAALLGGFCR